MSKYEELKSRYEIALKRVQIEVKRTLLFNIAFAGLWAVLVLSEKKIANSYCLPIISAILIVSWWRFSYFKTERFYDEQLSKSLIAGYQFEIEKKCDQKIYFSEAFKNFKPIAKVISRMTLLFFLMASFKIAVYTWLQYNYPEYVGTIRLLLKPLVIAYYAFMGWSIYKPFDSVFNFKNCNVQTS